MKRKHIFKSTLLATTALISSVAAPTPMILTPARAQTISTATTATQVLGPGGALIVTNSGAITSANPAISIPNVAADSVTNMGTVIAPTTAVLVSGGSGDLTGGIHNSGSIGVNATTANPIVLSVTGGADLSGGLSNTGTLSLVVNAAAGGTAHVFYANTSPISGTLTNNGMITLDVRTTAGFLSPYAIRFLNSPLSGSVYNNGRINSDISATGAGTGISLLNFSFRNANITGDFVNNGVISGVVNAAKWAGNYSGFNNSDIGGDYINNGTISHVSTASTRSASAAATFFSTGADIGGNFVNNGTLSATSTGVKYVGAWTVWGAAIIHGNFLNAGLIEANVTGGSTISVIPVSLYNNWDITGTLSNSGTIYAVANSPSAGGRMSGVEVTRESDIYGGLINSGIIKVELIAGAIAPSAVYVTDAGSDIAGFGLINTGVLSASGPGDAYGINVITASDISGGVHNSGLITGGTGIRVNGAAITGGITNTGTIIGTDGSGIRLEGLTALTPITLDGGRVTGSITDDTIANGFSPVTVSGNFATEGDLTVSSLTIEDDTEFTLSSGDAITLDSTLNNSGTFRGAGNIVGDIVNNGTIIPGYSIGTQTITGNYVQNNTGRLEIEVGNAGISDLLDITGTATLDGSVSFSKINGGLMVGDTFTFIKTTGGVAGTFATIEDDMLFVDIGNIQIIGSDVQAEVTNRTPYAAAGRGGNSTATAKALDRMIASGQGGDVDFVFNSFSNMDQAADLLLSQSGIATLSTISAANSSMQQTANLVRGRISAPPTPPMSGVSAGNAPDKSEPPFPLRKPTTLWVEAAGGFGDIEGEDTTPGHEYSVHSTAAGAELELDDAKVGAFVAFSRTHSELDNLADKGTVESYQAGVYGTRQVHENWRVNGSVSAAWLEFDTRRPTPAGTAEGDFSGYGFFAFNEFLYDLNPGENWTLSPYAGMEGSMVTHQGYSEEGAGALNMEVDRGTTHTLSSEVGLQINHEIKTHSNWYIQPTARIGWSHQFLDTSSKITSNFASAPAVKFNSEGPERNRDSARISFDLSAMYGEDAKTSFYAEYDGMVTGNAKDHTFTSGLKYKW